MRRWLAWTYVLAISDHILTNELPRTLANPYFRRHLTPENAAEATDVIRRLARLVPITVEVHGVATHPEDDLVLATAVSARADYLVTGDTRLQALGSYEGVQIVSPRAFLDILDTETSG
jgi:putative PIN family toxin of toxin-antitoxin system